MAKNRRNADFIVSTVRVHAAHVADQNRRIVQAAQQQRAVHNRTVEHLLRHQSDEPLQKRTAKGVTGLFGRWPNWRAENEALADTPSLVARGGISAASDQVAKWETTNREHAVLVAKAQTDAKPIPRRVQRRTPNPRRLYRARKQEERLGRHRVRIDENVRRVNRRTIHVPGVGNIQTKDDIPEDLDIRSCIILERTPRTRLKPGLDPTERTFRIHVTGRLPNPAAKNDDIGTACGIDHGVVTAMTVADTNENILAFQHDLDQARRATWRLRRLHRRISQCRTGSRTWKQRQNLNRRLRSKHDRRRRHRRRGWANQLAHAYDTICIEKLTANRMTRNSRGTSEAPGAKVAQKTGLNRSLLGIAPAEQTTILQRAAERTGTRVELVNPQRTSQQCNACGHADRKNRESQARFRCGSCGHTDNADANAARNIRDRGVATIRARMDASRAGDNPRPEGADARRRTERQERSRRPGTPAPSEKTPHGVRSKLQHARE